MLWRLLGILWPLQIIIPIGCIVNPNQESANMVIYMQKPHEILPQQWEHGLTCTTTFAKVFMERYKSLTRALNAIYTISTNLTNPMDYIQYKFLTKLHNFTLKLKSKRQRFRLTVVNDQGTEYDFEKTGNAIPTDFYIIIVDSIEKFEHLIKNRLTRLENWNPMAFFYIVYHNSLDYENEIKVTNAISIEMHKHFVERMVILYAREPNLYVFSLNNFLNAQKCRTINWKEIAECRNGVPKPDIQMVAINLQQFIKKYGKQNCTLRICATVSEPFIEAGCQKGLEVQILGTISRQLKIQSNVSCTKLSRGTLKANGQWTGLLGEMSNGSCDMIVGGFYPDNEVKIHFWVSQTYLEDSHTWFIKKANHRPPWRALLAIFKTEVWICFIVALFITCLAWYFFVNMLPEPESHKEFSLTAINALAVSICVAANERPLHYASRIFFYVLSLYGLTVMAIYTSRLIVVFKDPGYMYQIKTFDEVVEAQIPYGGPAENVDWFDEEPLIADGYNESEYFHVNYTNLMTVANGERVILGGRMYMSQSNLSDRIYPFTSNVFSSPLQFFMTYGAPFQNDLSLQILYCNDFGIVSKINQDFLYNNTYLNRISKQRPVFKEQAIVLTTEHFQGPFAVLIVGLFTSIFVFLAELQFHCFKTHMSGKENDNKFEKLPSVNKTQTKRANKTLNEQRTNLNKRDIKYGLVRKRNINKEQMVKPWFN